MYFVLRQGHYHDVAGQSFRRFMTSGLPDLPGIRATVGDFADHVTTVFTDVRLKRFLEMRGADAGRPDMMLAQSAFWTGLLYDDAALAAAEAVMQSHPIEDYRSLRPAVAERALDASLGRGTVRDLARDLLVIADEGLRARSCRDENGHDERRFLDPLRPLIAGGPTQAQHWLDLYDGEWKGDVSKIFVTAAV
jgi:glutamate--cysteine ligase